MEALVFPPANFGRFGDRKMLPPEEWIPSLIELMKSFQKDGAIRSLDALLMNLCEGDSVAALMLKHVMEWQPHGIRDDGAIWRSAEEWAQYTGLSRSMVYNPKRREVLTAAGLKVWVEKAMGVNTLHFRIEAARLTMNIGQLLGIGYHIAFTKLWRIVPAESSNAKSVIPFPKAQSSNAKTGVPFAKIPLTELTTENTTDKTTDVLFNSERFSVDEKAKYGVLPADVLRKIFDDADTKKREGKLRKSRLAYLRGALKIALGEHEEQAPVATPKSTPPLTPPRIQGGETTPEPAGTVPKWWIVAMDQLELQMRKNLWSYLGCMEFGGTDGETVIVIYRKVPLQMLQRYQRNIERVMGDAREAKTTVVFQEAG